MSKVGLVPDGGGAAELVASGPVLDVEWYAAQTGVAPDRATAAAHWVAHPRSGATPHPLFEPGWLYPDGRWQDRAPDPLSFFLRHGADRAPHPLLGRDPAAAMDWLARAIPDTLLPGGGGVATTYAAVRSAAFATLSATSAPSPRPEGAEVSVVLEVPGRFARVHWWLRQLHRTHGPGSAHPLALDVVVRTTTPAHRRIAATTAAAFPEARVAPDQDLDLGRVVVDVDPRLDPPSWPWLHLLLDRLAADDRPGRVQALLVEADQTVVAAGSPGPLLRGATPADVERMAHLPLAAAWPGVVATDTARPADAWSFVVPAARVVVPPGRVEPVTDDGPRGLDPGPWEAAGFDGPGRPRRTPGVLRWAIDIAAPLGPRGRRWGDDPFARSLAAALARLGQHVTVDHPETRGRASRDLDDVVLVVRGLEPVAPTPGALNLLWVISHPEGVTAGEVAGFDVVLAAGPAWAARRSREWGFAIEPLLQCTDADRFRPGDGEPDSGPGVLFVGNARGRLRPAVAAALDSGADLTLYGDGWAGLVPDHLIAGIHVPNEQLGALYASAGVVLADHWDDMRAEGFVSNRVFDVLACGGRLVTDEPAGLRDQLGDLLDEGALVTWRDPDELRARLGDDPRARFPDAASRRRTAERVRVEHSFDARARTLLDRALAGTSNLHPSL